MSGAGVWRGGGCHCGAVRFEARLAYEVPASTCTCSICRRTGFIHIVVPESGFRLLGGADHLTSYRFNTGVADHLFCAACGVKSFYRPRSNPDGWSVNARCLDEPDAVKLDMDVFDGAQWEDHWRAHGAELAERSKEAP
ncbi:MAG: GFA family protein [Caulobacteraceae bacterium]